MCCWVMNELEDYLSADGWTLHSDAVDTMVCFVCAGRGDSLHCTSQLFY